MCYSLVLSGDFRQTSAVIRTDDIFNGQMSRCMRVYCQQNICLEKKDLLFFYFLMIVKRLWTRSMCPIHGKYDSYHIFTFTPLVRFNFLPMRTHFHILVVIRESCNRQQCLCSPGTYCLVPRTAFLDLFHSRTPY